MESKKYFSWLIMNMHYNWMFGWWFQAFLIFNLTWPNDPIWRAYFFKRVAKKTQLDIQVSSFLNLQVTSFKKTMSNDGQILATPPSKKGLPPPNDKGLTMVYIII